jgi:hypothetical protein
LAKLIAAPIPSTLDELTPEWLDMALRSRGVLQTSRVTGARPEVLGEGEGFVGLIARLHLEFDAPEPNAPKSIVAKLPTPLALNRSLGEMLGAYEREIRFYEELADRVAVATPRCYYAAMDASPLEGREEQSLRFVRRLPSWLLRWLVPCFIWLAGHSRRRYVLLLEDLAEASVGDQVAGCSASKAERIIESLATNQAALWDSPELEGRHWLSSVDLIPRISQLMFQRNRAQFFSIYRDRLGQSERTVVEIADWLEHNGLWVMAHLASRPHTILHGDFRLDNLFFSDPSKEEITPWMIAIDWQLASVGRGPYDLAYFATGNIPGLADCEEQIVRHYHKSLEAGGVAGYAFDACWRDYQIAKLLLLHRLISGAGMLDLSHERGQQILDRTFEGILATLPTDDLDALLLPS